MDSGLFILKTKLTPPQIKRNILRRSSLTRKMKLSADHPLMLVTSGPGYGKSIALSSFLRTEKTPFFWYSLEHHDDDLVPFLLYMLHAIRERYPGFGEEMLRILSGGNRFDESEVIYICSLFINEASQMPEDVIFVLDDFHNVIHSDPINQFLVYLFEHQPSKLHFIISSRLRPKWSLLTTLKVKGDLIEITEQDLSFTEEEIEVLFSDFFEYPLHRDHVQGIYQVTEGWIIAVQMVWQQLSANGDLSVILQKKAGSMRDLFQFLAMEVLSKQPQHVRQFLIETSIFNDFSTEMCEQVLEMEQAPQMLDLVTNQRLFITYVGENQYRYHALFRDFLLEELLQLPEQFHKLNQRAAQYFRNSADNQRSIYHLTAIRDYEKVAEILQSYGQQLINNGQLENLLNVIHPIPAAYKNRYYMLWIYEGELYRYRCLYEKAAFCYETGGRLAEEAGDRLGQIRALEGQSSIYLDTLQPGKAEGPLLQALQLHKAAGHQTMTQDDEQQFHLYYLLAENLLNSARLTEAINWYDQLREFNQEDNLKVRFHLRTGRLLQARKILMQRKNNNSEKWGGLHSEAHRYTDHYISLIDAFTGNQESSKTHAQSGIILGVTSRAPYLEALGWMRLGHAGQLMHQYDFSVPYDCYKTSLDIMESLNLPRGRAEPLMGLCLLYGKNKLIEQAIECGEMGIAETEKVNDVWVSTLIRLAMGIAYVYVAKWEEAESYLTRCTHDFEKCGDSYGLTVSLMWLAFMAFQTDRDKVLDSYLEALFKQMRNGNFEFLMQRRTFFGPSDEHLLSPLLFAALKKDIHTSYVTELINKLGIGHTNYHPGYTLRVQTLGAFKVWLGEKELEERDWQRGKVKELFQLMLVNRQRWLAREDIYDLIWRSASEKAFLRDFKVALSVLNSTLEPCRALRSAPFFIRKNGNSYSLNMSSGIELDVVQFEQWVKEGLAERDPQRSKQLLMRGLEFYQGDFLPERIYEDWCIDERERLQVLFVQGSERLAQLSAKDKEYDRAIYWCERILQLDSCWEEAYRLLMHSHLQRNNRQQALKWFQKCELTLQKELGVPPMPATMQMYKLVMESTAIDLQP